MGETGTFFMLLQQEKSRRELAEILACNEETARFGLALSQMEAQELAVCRNESLRRWQRVEFGRGICGRGGKRTEYTGPYSRGCAQN
ncbi:MULTISPECIES: DUF6323 family protein [unclassified Clostridium]|uniref:DUF6323 family protein n=1 Tax=unclassified Clostridium TaxID=2614128 RepID=UPI0011071745|nr:MULTISPECIES: DUF6323 family protein [unclassified Clostridium]